jgi:hypothetical protein
VRIVKNAAPLRNRDCERLHHIAGEFKNSAKPDNTKRSNNPVRQGIA